MLNALVVSALLLSRLDSPVSDRADALLGEPFHAGILDPHGVAAAAIGSGDQQGAGEPLAFQ